MNINGLSIHIGSQICKIDPFRKAFNAYIEKMKIKFTSEDFDRAAKKSVGDKIVQMIKDYEK